jgi:hypothetical protein
MLALQAFADASSAVVVAEMVPEEQRDQVLFDEAWDLHESLRDGLARGWTTPDDPRPGLRVLPGGKDGGNRKLRLMR